jgi:hypothetical protein
MTDIIAYIHEQEMSTTDQDRSMVVIIRKGESRYLVLTSHVPDCEADVLVFNCLNIETCKTPTISTSRPHFWNSHLTMRDSQNNPNKWGNACATCAMLVLWKGRQES